MPRLRFVSAAVFVLAAVMAAIVVIESESARRQHERMLVDGLAKDYSRHLEAYIERALSASSALAALVEASQGDIHNFDDVASRLLRLYPGASELVLAPGGTIRHIAPLRGNEKALGLDLSSYPVQRTEAPVARDTRGLTLAGPLELVQGGQALAGRLPVYLKSTEGESLWGFTEVVMRLPGALAPAQLARLSAQGYLYRLWRVPPQAGGEQSIATSSSGTLIDPVEEAVHVPNGTWTLSVAPTRGWGDPIGVSLKAAVGLIVALLSGYLAEVLLELKTRRRELEALLAQRAADVTVVKESLKATLDAIPDLVWLKDADGRYLSCNPQLERYFGASEAQIVGRTDYDFVERQLADSFRENDRKAVEVDRSRANEEWLTFATNGYRGLFETLKTPMRDRGGKLIGVLGIARDITARYRAEKAAKASRTRLRVALQATQIAIWEWDIKRDRWYASRVYYTGLGYTPEPGRGNTEVWMERVHPEDRPRVRATIEAVLRGDSEVYEYEARLRHADGSYRWTSARGKATARDAQGRATRMVGVRWDITDKKKAEERVQRLAHYDTLTALPNRALLTERMSDAIALALAGRESLAVLVLDIDKFKNINDTFGHAIGDELLLEVAKRIQSLAREEDMVARIGGDTFVMVLSGAKAQQAARTAQRLLDSMSTPFRTRQLEFVVTPSIGIALFPTHGADFDALFKCADTAMHRAKSHGRNHFVFFTEEMQVRSARNLVIENTLRHAIDRGELYLHYQPQISLLDGRITGAEALLRWTNPDLGTVSPTEFIPITEDSGQILQIGTWVLRSAALQLRDWLAAGLEPFTLAINLSSVQFRHPNLPGLIRKILLETNLKPSYLELELTERVAMDDPAGAITIMNELHELGVQISIDDFGTGYSSLNYLKRFRAYKLKIDQSFVRGLDSDPEDQAIVKAIINLAGSLGMDTIAEGVETAAQAAFLQSHGCKKAQGFHFSHPLPADEFAALARNPTHPVRVLQRG
jgi:diguanylate cyclase (GGDEF)-like protein/PAS domain S-box-containing protein